MKALAKWRRRTKEKKRQAENLSAVSKWTPSLAPCCSLHPVLCECRSLIPRNPFPKHRWVSPDTQLHCQARSCLPGIYYLNKYATYTQKRAHTRKKLNWSNKFTLSSVTRTGIWKNLAQTVLQFLINNSNSQVLFPNLSKSTEMADVALVLGLYQLWS